jgi:hypothetical protein
MNLNKWSLFLILLFTLFFNGCKTFEGLMRKGDVVSRDTVATFSFSYRDNLIFLPVVINGVTRQFILDTGAPNVIDDGLKQELNLKKIWSSQVGDSQNNSSRLDYVSINSLQFGSVEIENTTALVADLDVLYCLDIDGILGANAMAHFDWLINYHDSTIQLLEPQQTMKWAENCELALPFSSSVQRTPKLNIQLDGIQYKGVTFDTGSVNGITLRKGKSSSLDPYDAVIAYGFLSKGIFGSHKDSVWYARVDQIDIAGVELENQVVKMQVATSSKIGNALLDNYDVLVSWSQNMVYLQPRLTESEGLPGYLLKIGYLEDRLQVLALYNEFDNEQQIMVGDQVVSLNGTSTETLSLMAFCELRQHAPAYYQIHVRRQGDGEVVDLNLQVAELEF